MVPREDKASVKGFENVDVFATLGVNPSLIVIESVQQF